MVDEIPNSNHVSEFRHPALDPHTSSFRQGLHVPQHDDSSPEASRQSQDNTPALRGLQLLATKSLSEPNERGHFPIHLPNNSDTFPLGREELQKVVDDLEKARFFPESDPVLLNELLRRVVSNTGVLPTHWSIHEETSNVSPYPDRLTDGATVSKGDLKGKPVAIKRLRGRRATLKALSSELVVWSNLDHPHVLPFMGLLATASSLPMMVSPYMRNNTIAEFLEGHLDANRLELLSGVASGLSYMHGLPNPIMHGDIRSANILVDDQGRAVIADLGSSEFVKSVEAGASPRGSARWMSPETLLPGSYAITEKIDVWSFGCLCIEVFTGKYPFHHLVNDGAVVLEVLRYNGRPPRPQSLPSARQLSDSLWALMEQCWELNPADRPSMSRIYLHLGA